MKEYQTLFLTKEQCKNKGNGIHLTQEQLDWLRGVVSDGKQSNQSQEESKNKEDLYLSYHLSIKKELMGKIRTFCYQHGVNIRDFFETVILDSKMLNDIAEIQYGLGTKKEHKMRPIKNTTNKKLYAEMASLGYMTKQETAILLGVNESTVSDYMKKGLVHLRKGRFSFFKKEDVESFSIKILKKRHKEF